MRSFIRVIVAAGLVAAVLGSGPAHALVYSSCGGSYSGTTGCMFTPGGPNVYLYGDTTANGLRVRVSDPTGNVRVLECYGQFSCNAVMGPDSTGTDSVGPPAAGPLLCMVITSGAGHYGCSSGI